MKDELKKVFSSGKNLDEELSSQEMALLLGGGIDSDDGSCKRGSRCAAGSGCGNGGGCKNGGVNRAGDCGIPPEDNGQPEDPVFSAW